MALDKEILDELQKEAARYREELKRESNLVRDQNDKAISDTKIVVKDLEKVKNELEQDILNLQLKFNKEYSSHVALFEKDKEQLAIDISNSDSRSRELDEKENKLKKQSEEFLITQNDLIEKNKELINSNNAILAEITQSRKQVNQCAIENNNASEVLSKREALLQDAIIRLENESKALDQKKSELVDLKEEATSLNNKANSLFEKAQVIKESNAKDINILNEKISEQNFLKIENQNLLDEIQEQKNKNQILVDEQVKNLNTIQLVTEKNKADLIALRALEAMININSREIKERMNNLKILESNVKL